MTQAPETRNGMPSLPGIAQISTAPPIQANDYPYILVLMDDNRLFLSRPGSPMWEELDTDMIYEQYEKEFDDAEAH